MSEIKLWPQRAHEAEAEVVRLRAELQNAAKAALDATALTCEKEREADALRVEAEVLRDAMERIASGDLDGYRSWIAAREALKRVANPIYAAMGEGK
jgi:hypothetical protein